MEEGHACAADGDFLTPVDGLKTFIQYTLPNSTHTFIITTIVTDRMPKNTTIPSV